MAVICDLHLATWQNGNSNAVGVGGQWLWFVICISRLDEMEPACGPFLEKQFACRRTGTNYFPQKSP